MFHLNILKVDRMLHMLQWHQWLVDNSLLQGFGSYLAPSSLGAPHPPLPFLPSISPSPPFLSLHLAVVVRARRETLPDKHTKTRGGGGLSWVDGSAMLA